MAVQFPAIEPTEQPDFAMPEIPGAESVSVSGIRSYRKMGSVAVDALLSLTFGNKTNAQGAEILRCYQQASWIEPLTLPPILFNNAGAELDAVLDAAGPASGLKWFFAKGSAPTLSRVPRSGGRLVRVQVQLRAELRLGP